jgi:hypothetical protein
MHGVIHKALIPETAMKGLNGVGQGASVQVAQRFKHVIGHNIIHTNVISV